MSLTALEKPQGCCCRQAWDQRDVSLGSAVRRAADRKPDPHEMPIRAVSGASARDGQGAEPGDARLRGPSKARPVIIHRPRWSLSVRPPRRSHQLLCHSPPFSCRFIVFPFHPTPPTLARVIPVKACKERPGFFENRWRKNISCMRHNGWNSEAIGVPGRFGNRIGEY
jgi:hypothetical protein